MSVNIEKPKIYFCSNCVYPSSSAVSLDFDSENKCTGCQVVSEKKDVDWESRKFALFDILKEYEGKNNSNYDCVIPVSGGKDSYFQIHLVTKVLNLNPLLVTYNANNYTKTGLENLQNMREVFDCDHIFFTPSVNTLVKLNKIGMTMMGDMNWHAHMGIRTIPIQTAVRYNIPLMFWGEHGRSDVGGMFNHNDFIEFTYRAFLEHDSRGFSWKDAMIEAKKHNITLNSNHLDPWRYPKDEEIERVGVRGLFISNFFYWDANKHGPMMVEQYGFKESEESFERTYRRMSNLDDMHENGIHDYMKFIKFGYGRCSDHASKDIRSGKLTRDQAIAEVKSRDHVKPRDLNRWLNYVGWTEEQFDSLADTFRDPRVWWIKNGKWWKHNLWGDSSSYGSVKLDKDKWIKFYNE
ncbi:MAG: LPS biosynthesis protein [Candidatus Pelagibacter sp.]|nr:LPS biosynthesis protein [Candidatus Pelagibacter sp.]